MTTALALTTVPRIPAVPWRDPHNVSLESLAAHIQTLEVACLDDPKSAPLRTCLGMAYAMNYQVYESMDALEAAIELEPDYFFAQFKYAELHYRLRALVRAEQATIKALDLASNAWEFSLARSQLQTIRKLMREGTQKPEWTKPLIAPLFSLLSMVVLLSLVAYWK